VALEPRCQPRQLVGVGQTAATDGRIGIGERPQDRAGRRERRVAAAGERRTPVVRHQPVAGDGVDHRRVDIADGGDVVGREADRRAHGIERGERGIHGGVRDRHPAGHEHVALLADARGDEAGGDGGCGEVGDGAQPRQRVRLGALARAQRAEPPGDVRARQPDGGRADDVTAREPHLDRGQVADLERVDPPGRRVEGSPQAGGEGGVGAIPAPQVEAAVDPAGDDRGGRPGWGAGGGPTLGGPSRPEGRHAIRPYRGGVTLSGSPEGRAQPLAKSCVQYGVPFAE
jgi:hypothetical protein